MHCRHWDYCPPYCNLVQTRLHPEQIADEYEHLTLAQVYAALTYYHANQSEVEADLAAEDAEIERLEQEHYKVPKSA